MKIIFPDGTEKDSVLFYGYRVYKDGRVLNRKGNKYLCENPGHFYTFYIDTKPFSISKRALLQEIFHNTDRLPSERVNYPDGRKLESVGFYGYTLFRNGRILTATGKESNTAILVIKVGDSRINIRTAWAMYSIFSGIKVKKSQSIGFRDGNTRNFAFDNLCLVGMAAKSRPRVPKLSQSQCEAIRSEYGLLCDRQIREIEKINHKGYRKRPSMNYLAAKYGVSRMTIMHVVNNNYHGL